MNIQMGIKILDDSWAMLTTNCPKCNTEFTRKCWLDSIIAGSTLDLCNNCDTGEIIVMEKNV